MREIKFRCWNKEKKEMDMHAHNRAWFGPLASKGDEREGIVMQYTGLKDKNGVEIYEGDVVKGVGEHEGQSEVFCDNILWYPFQYLSDYQGENFEIIGNIYENPELIK